MSKHKSHKCKKSKHSSKKQKKYCNHELSNIGAPRLGACCLDGICSIEDERWCLENGGYWKGLGTNCWNVTCPNAALGACRTVQGCILTDEYNCPGIWLGPYTNCQNMYGYYPPNQYYNPFFRF